MNKFVFKVFIVYAILFAIVASVYFTGTNTNSYIIGLMVVFGVLGAGSFMSAFSEYFNRAPRSQYAYSRLQGQHPNNVLRR